MRRISSGHGALTVLGLALSLGCSVMLDTGGQQCQSDADCRRANPALALACIDHVCTTRDGGTYALPVVLDQHFRPTGLRGDALGAAVEASVDCPLRAGMQRGECHVFGYDVSRVTSAARYASVTWQSPDGNWGDEYGFAMPAGARSISFYAWSDSPGVNVVFGAGHREGDDFEVRTPQITLETTPRQYWIDLADASYADVAGGFVWEAAAPASGSAVTLYLDDIVWSSEPAPAPPVPVTFQVDMSTRALRGDCSVYVYGTWNDWTLDDAGRLSDPDGNGIYRGTVMLPVAEEALYKFAYQCGAAAQVTETLPPSGSCGVDSGSALDRSVTPTSARTLDVVCFGRCDACDDLVPVTVQVDLGTTALGPDCTVHAPGSFNGWNEETDSAMTRTSGSVFAFEAMMSPGLREEYKFMISCPARARQWENLSSGSCAVLSGGFLNRFHVAAEPVTLSPACFGSCSPCP